ncbi:MAG: helix-turn-helix domain-containing protein [Alphaproteobacteria bacterium]
MNLKVDYIDAHVSKKLKYYRKARKLSQSDLAEKLNTTFQQIQKHEKGLSHISASNMYRYSLALGISIDQLYDNMDSKKTGTKKENLDKSTMKMLSMFKDIENEELKKDIIKFIKSMVKK